jgi:hypothetical protein
VGGDDVGLLLRQIWWRVGHGLRWNRRVLCMFRFDEEELPLGSWYLVVYRG